MRVSDANALTGGLSNPSKMPGKSFGLPAAGAACPIGAKLAKLPGTVCSGCYAVKGMYGLPTVQAAQEKRFRAVKKALASTYERMRWLNAMHTLVSKQAWFRWHDSGDVFSYDYLLLIVEVVRDTLNTRHWLPTRERATVKRYLQEQGPFPENLTVRLSLPKVDARLEDAAKLGAFYGLPTSTVTTEAPSCPAPKQGNECKDCRACWDATVSNVSYKKH